MQQSDPPTISTAALDRWLSAGDDLWLVYAPDRAAFADGHIPGSLAAPDGPTLAVLLGDGAVVVYGEDRAAQRPQRLAHELTERGADVRWYAGGLRAWHTAGLAVDAR